MTATLFIWGCKCQVPHASAPSCFAEGGGTGVRHPPPRPHPQSLATPLRLPFPKYTLNTFGGSLGQGRGEVRQV